MKSSIKGIKFKGKKEPVGNITVYRSLPNPKIQAIGSVVFLDHISTLLKAKKPELPNGKFAHPHRGIATFSYIIEGGIHHLDSNGGEGVVFAGGIQWMKAGNGIIHDEFMPFEFQRSGGNMQGLQFWLNLPAKNKMENPNYMSVKSENVAEVSLPDNAGITRVLLGEYKNKKSEIPTYLKQNIFHVKLNPKKTISFSTHKDWEYGIYAINNELNIEENLTIKAKELVKLTNFKNSIQIQNKNNKLIDFIFISGELYTEPMVSYGPFIMNSSSGIQTAYNDFQLGKYGLIDYSKIKT